MIKSIFSRGSFNARFASLLRNSISSDILRSFDQQTKKLHLNRYLLGYASKSEEYPIEAGSPKTLALPRGFVASHRWFEQRPTEAFLQSYLFGSSRKPLVIEKKYMSARLKASVSGIPIRDGFSYSEVQKLADIPMLDRRLIENLCQMGLDELTPVQRHAISILSLSESVPIEGKVADRVVGQYDLMAAAQTGSGKTLAYFIPIINRLLCVYPYEAMQNVSKNQMCQYPSGLVLVPTRELVQQIRDVALKLTYRTFCRVVGLYGGESATKQQHELYLGCHLVVATPGRLLDFLSRGLLNLENCRSLVLDEADRMLDMGFEDDLRQILESPAYRMPPPRDSERQTCLFSATFPSEVAVLAKNFMRGSRCISLTLSDQDFGAVVPEWGEAIGKSTKAEELAKLCHMVPREINQQFQFVSDPSPNAMWNHLVALVRSFVSDDKHVSEAIECTPDRRVSRPVRILIFCNTKFEVDHVDRLLHHSGIKTIGLHGDKSQDRRSKAIEMFKQGKVNVMVASSVAARGLDIPDVTAVINVGIPRDAEDYVHRIGRTGRMGNRGEAITVVNETNLARSSSSLVKAILAIFKSSGSLSSVPSAILEHAHGHTEQPMKKRMSYLPHSIKPMRREQQGFRMDSGDSWRY